MTSVASASNGDPIADSSSLTHLTSLLPSHWQSASLEELREAKGHLRRHIRRHLSSLSPSDVSTQSHAAVHNFLTSPLTSALLSSSPAFAVYLSMPRAELLTSPLLSSLFAHRRRVFVPVVRSATAMELLEAHGMDDIASFPVNAWGIPQPPDEWQGRRRVEALEVVDEVGVCVVPAVAFSKDGGRLGHGRGYYDRYLSRWEEERRRKGLEGSAMYVGLGLDCQLVERLPFSDRDVRMHAVIGPHTHHFMHSTQQQHQRHHEQHTTPTAHKSS